MAFWGVEVRPGRVAPYVPPPEVAQLRITQATLGLDAASNEKVALCCKVGKAETLICSLKEGSTESTNLDIVLDQYAEFSVKTNAPQNAQGSIHLIGYHVIENEQEEEDGDEEMGDEIGGDLDPQMLAGMTPDVLQRLLQLKALRAGTNLDADDDDEDDDEEDLDSEDDDSDTEGQVQEDEERPSVIIEEIFEDEAAKPEVNKEDVDAQVTLTTSTLVQQEGEAGKAALVQETENRSPTEPVTGNGSNLPKEVKKKEKDKKKKKQGSKDVQANELDLDEASRGDKEAVGDDRADIDIEAFGGDESDIEDILSDPEEDDSDAIDEEINQDELESVKAETIKAGLVTGRRTTQPGAKADENATKRAAKEVAAKAEPASKKHKGEATPAVSPQPSPAGATPLKGVKKYPNGFIVENVSMGDPSGKLAKAGKKVSVKYIGKLEKSGQVFDKTKGEKPFTFRLGVGEVIKGWDQGVVGMRVGDTRRLTVPPQMGYGPKGVSPVIPGNATLLFDVTLVNVKG